MRRALCLIFCLIPTATLPCERDGTAKLVFETEKSALFTQLAQESTEPFSRALIAAIWDLWFDLPDSDAKALLTAGVGEIRISNFRKAEELLRQVTALCPNQAEGWNQLAFAQFLQRDFDGSEVNLHRTLELEPRHFGAMAGLGLIAAQRGDVTEAKGWIRAALRLNPYLRERSILDLPDPAPKDDQL